MAREIAVMPQLPSTDRPGEVSYKRALLALVLLTVLETPTWYNPPPCFQLHGRAFGHLKIGDMWRCHVSSWNTPQVGSFQVDLADLATRVVYDPRDLWSMSWYSAMSCIHLTSQQLFSFGAMIVFFNGTDQLSRLQAVIDTLIQAVSCTTYDLKWGKKSMEIGVFFSKKCIKGSESRTLFFFPPSWDPRWRGAQDFVWGSWACNTSCMGFERVWSAKMKVMEMSGKWCWSLILPACYCWLSCKDDAIDSKMDVMMSWCQRLRAPRCEFAAPDRLLKLSSDEVFTISPIWDQFLVKSESSLNSHFEL